MIELRNFKINDVKRCLNCFENLKKKNRLHFEYILKVRMAF